MPVLSTELAEKIIERTMEVVNHNINIMNERGIIIASGDKGRIGTIHEGAIIAIQRKAEFIIDEKQSLQLSGVYPGINLVIEFYGDVVGVIGITGKPKDVLGYGKLIKMTAEMIIEQAYVMKEIEWNHRIKEEMLTAIIHNKQESSRLLQDYMKKFKIPQNQPMAISIIDVMSRGDYVQGDEKALNKVVDMLEGCFKESLAAAVDSNTIVLLYKCTKNNSLAEHEETFKVINKKIHESTGVKTCISVGKAYEKLTDLYKSYDIAWETLQFGKMMYPKTDVYIFDELKDEMLFKQYREGWRINELRNTYELLVENYKSGELRDTLKVLIEENGDLNTVANKLAIHRNTLNYRLKKIHKLTDKDPKKYMDLFWLYSAIINFQVERQS